MAPHVVGEIRDATGKVVRRTEPDAVEAGRVAGTAAAVRRHDGRRRPAGHRHGRRRPRRDRWPARPARPRPAGGRHRHAWFVGFAPAERPAVALAVIVEGRRLGDEATGGRVAAPVVGQVLAKLLALPPTPPPAAAGEDKPASTTAGTRPGGRRLPPMPERVYTNRYEIVRHIARGGMAEVYLAHDHLLDRRVALKVLSPEFARDPSFVERFRREAQAAANLNHPNIVSVYDWGEEDGTYFIVMEYVEGRSLRDIIQRARAAATRTGPPTSPPTSPAPSASPTATASSTAT